MNEDKFKRARKIKQAINPTSNLLLNHNSAQIAIEDSYLRSTAQNGQNPQKQAQTHSQHNLSRSQTATASNNLTISLYFNFIGGAFWMVVILLLMNVYPFILTVEKNCEVYTIRTSIPECPIRSETLFHTPILDFNDTGLIDKFNESIYYKNFYIMSLAVWLMLGVAVYRHICQILLIEKFGALHSNISQFSVMVGNWRDDATEEGC